jgi:tetratricopeptide (TPR) repeat protein
MQIRVGRSMGIVVAAAFAATLAFAQTEPATTAAAKTPRILSEHQARYRAALLLVRSGKKEEGLAQLQKLSEDLRAELSEPGVDYFCNRGNDSETVHFVALKTMGNAAPTRIVVLGDLPCNVLFSQAYMLVESKRMPEARDVLERLLPMAPFNSAYKSELAHVLSMLGQPLRSLSLYREAEANAEFDGKDEQAHQRAVALRGQGYALVELGRWDEAEAAYRKSLTYEPDSQLAKGELAFIRDQRPKASAPQKPS